MGDHELGPERGRQDCGKWTRSGGWDCISERQSYVNQNLVETEKTCVWSKSSSIWLEYTGVKVNKFASLCRVLNIRLRCLDLIQ